MVVPRLVLGHTMNWREATFLVWGVLAAVLLACSVLAATSRGHFPDVAALFRVLTAGAIGRFLLLLGWAWLGWHAFAR